MLKKISKYFPKHKISDVEKKYKIGKVLGSGNFSVVKRCTNKETGKDYALKIIDKKLVAGKEEMIETETEILRKVKHTNIVSMVETFDTPDKLYVVMDLATGGELFDRIVEKGSYTEKDASQLCKSILEAIAYLHDNDIVHRDLKPENLLFSDPTDDATIMVTDFGLSKLANDATALTTACGTPGYVAPEVLKQKGYGKEVDLWSVGVITYILLCGYPPFYDEDQSRLFETIVKGKFDFHPEYWGNISESAKDLIRKLLTVDVNARYNAKQALQHPWVSGQTASATDITQNVKSGFNRFNPKAKLRGAVMTVQMINRLNKLTNPDSSSSSASNSPAPASQSTATAPSEQAQ